MIVAIFMVMLLLLVVLLLRDVIDADQPGSKKKLGIFAFKDDKDAPSITKNKRLGS